MKDIQKKKNKTKFTFDIKDSFRMKPPFQLAKYDVILNIELVVIVIGGQNESIVYH